MTSIVEYTTSSLEMLNDISNQATKKIKNLGFVYIKNCEFLRKETTSIQIQCETDDDVPEKTNLFLDVKNNDGIVYICTNTLQFLIFNISFCV